jgi:ankyrin repeat protein
MFAAQHGHDEVVRRLLAAGADVNARGDHGRTALDFASANGHAATARILEEPG